MTEDEAIARLEELGHQAEDVAARVNWPVLLVMVLACVVTALVALTLPFARNASNTSDSIAKSTEVAGCRSAAGAGVTDARNTKEQRSTDLEILGSSFNEALLNGDRAQLVQLRADFPTARKALRAAAKALDRANDAYQVAIKLSNNKPDVFLRRCRAGQLVVRPSPATTSTTTTTTAIVPPTATAATVARRPARRSTPTASTVPSVAATPVTTSTTVYRSSPKPTPLPCVSGALPIDLEIPCL